MNDITEQSIDALRRSIRDSFQVDVYRQQLRAEARRYQPVSVTEELAPTIKQPVYAELKAARDLLEAHGLTVVPNHRLACVTAEHRFDWREIEGFGSNLEGIIKSVSGGLAGHLGVQLVGEGGALFHDRTGTMDRVIGYSAAVILPKSK